ncbi:hypothetical protein WN55_11176 [Dufourea novaeangliae]|uniref:Uncharacterized protein n=1 Tax=Dufourea novaeangliae TaxID=178035 RepID=A0A154PC87_DUFNO|nr:hypothetical protein WN55_11176 [Dufourea novaeangliae]
MTVAWSFAARWENTTADSNSVTFSPFSMHNLWNSSTTKLLREYRRDNQKLYST